MDSIGHADVPTDSERGLTNVLSGSCRAWDLLAEWETPRQRTVAGPPCRKASEWVPSSPPASPGERNKHRPVDAGRCLVKRSCAVSLVDRPAGDRKLELERYTRGRDWAVVLAVAIQIESVDHDVKIAKVGTDGADCATVASPVAIG